MRRLSLFFSLWLAALLLAGCASMHEGDTRPATGQWDPAQAGSASTAGGEAGAWQHQTFPGKRQNRYQYVWREGRPAMAVSSDRSISALRRTLMDATQAPQQVQFSWKVAGLIPDADLQHSAKEDSPVRLMLVFDGDRSRLSARDVMLSELVRTLTGEELPYATLMYVWSNHLPVGTVVNNKRTDRIRKLVIESGTGGVNRWLDYERDIRADYEQVFGEPPGALKAVAIMSDTDNTGGSVRAWYGPIRFDQR